MKIFVDRFFILTILLLSMANTLATPSPPAPGAKKPPPPPGLPIDDNILFLLIIAILFGIYIICKFQVKTKAPI